MEQLYDKKTTCCFTGHRDIPYIKRRSIKTALQKAIAEHISNGILTFVTGGALGFDTLAAQCVLKARSKNQGVRLVMILPCRDQCAKWASADRQVYEKHIASADKVYFLNEKYVTGCMHQRNRAMLDQSGFCIAYYDGKPGGTAYTFKLAEEQGLVVTNLYR